MGHVNLQDAAYVNITQGSNKRDLERVKDEVVLELVTNNARLVNDVESGLIPHGVLEQEIIKYLDKNKITMENNDTRYELIKRVKDYIFGYGPLQDLINRNDISDIRVVSKDYTWAKIKGRRYLTDIKFSSNKSLLTYCYYLCFKNGSSISEMDPVKFIGDYDSNSDFILRLNVNINPVNRKSPSIHIRKIPKDKLLLEDLMKENMFNEDIYEYLKEAAKTGLNILWCGRGGSGKTYLMNACMEEILVDKAVLVMQEIEELHSKRPNIEFQASKAKSGESDVEYTLRDLTINGLRKDLDYMIIGEIKGAEAMDLFNASFTGHTAWTSIHSDSSTEALDKAVHYMKYSGTDLKRQELLKMLSKMDVVIFMKNFKCFEITEIDGYDDMSNSIIYNPVFRYDINKDFDGKYNGSFKRVGESCNKIVDKIKLAEFQMEGGKSILRL